MVIQQKSFCTFLLKTKNIDVLVNPTNKAEESILIYSSNNIEELNKDQNENNIIISSPGEYEAKDVFIVGKKTSGSDVVLYKINAEDLVIGVISFVKDINTINLDFFEDCDIILIGTSDSDLFLSLKDSEQLIQQLSPSIAILFGFKEQLSSKHNLNLSSIAELKESNPRVQSIDKTLKIESDTVSNSDTTEIYYFDI